MIQRDVDPQRTGFFCLGRSAECTFRCGARRNYLKQPFDASRMAATQTNWFQNGVKAAKSTYCKTIRCQELVSLNHFLNCKSYQMPHCNLSSMGTIRSQLKAVVDSDIIKYQKSYVMGWGIFEPQDFFLKFVKMAFFFLGYWACIDF